MAYHLEGGGGSVSLDEWSEAFWEEDRGDACGKSAAVGKGRRWRLRGVVVAASMQGHP